MVKKNDTSKILLKGKSGIRLSLHTGTLEQNHPNRWSTEHFYHALPGNYIQLKDKNYEYAVATYTPEPEEIYLYTYAYQQEQNWTRYNHDLTPESYRQSQYTFTKETYFRINVKRCDDSPLTSEDNAHIAAGIEYYSTKKPHLVQDWFQHEITQTAETVREALTVRENKQAFLLLTDSHYVVNGTWEDTIANMQAVCDKLAYSQITLDGMIHLGDMTDGMVSRQVTQDYIQMMMKDMEGLKLPLYMTMGNHDSNYFKNNPDKLTEEEQYELYLKSIHKQSTDLYYYKDIEEIEVRFIFLSSFDYREKVRYGFSDSEAQWFETILSSVPKHYRILVFSHVPPLPVIHYWSDTIRNGEKMVSLVEEQMQSRNLQVLGWIHGHNHAEQVYKERQFPIISLGCNKCEYFEDKKPEGSFTYPRKMKDISQDLWDILILEKDSAKLNLIRFGAGIDRII